VLVPAGAEHQVLDGLAGILALFENQFHLLGDGHLDPPLAGKAERCPRGMHALGHLTAQRCENLGKFLSVAEFYADGAVPRQRARAGKHQVAQTRQPGERLAAPSAGY